ncbi:MAG: winged helix-turn-helix domain-containing protein [Acidobacteriota bacterium]
MAVDLLRKGSSQSEAARQVGVHRQSVSRWARQLKQGGRRSLRKAKNVGRPSRLDAADLRRVERGLKRGPEALGFENGLWTSGRVAELIEVECGVRYHPSHVWRILRQLGWTCQRPTGRALERNEATIRWWKKTRWPVLKKTPSARGKRSSSSTRAD